MGKIATVRNDNTTIYGEHGALRVEGTKLKDANGKNVQLRGISTHNIAIYPEYINKELLTQFVDEYGITVFRLAMYTGAADGFPGYSNETPENKTNQVESPNNAFANNKNVNLTAIRNIEDVYLKHFYDSIKGKEKFLFQYCHPAC